MKKRLISVIAIVFATLFSQCENVLDLSKKVETPGEHALQEIPSGNGKITIYLNGPQKTSFNLFITLNEIEVQKDNGTKEVILTTPRVLNSLTLLESQILLGDAFLPPGKYKRIIFRFSEAKLVEKGKEISLVFPQEGFKYEFEFEIFPSSNTPIFIDWDADRAVEKDYFLRSCFFLKTKTPEPRGLLAYVTNEGSNNVSVINRENNQVISVIEVGNSPKGIVANHNGSRVYVANFKSNNISVIDTNSNRVLQNINLEFGAGPEDIAISPDGKTLFTANYLTDTVSVIDAETFQIIDSVRVGNKPVSLATDPRRNFVYVANSISNNISVIDSFSRRVINTIQVESMPVDIAVDSSGREIYVANLNSNNLSVLSADTMKVTKKNVGLSAISLAPDRFTRKIYIGKKGKNVVSLFDVDLNIELCSIPVKSSPRNMLIDHDRGKIYVVNTESNRVTVVDKFSRAVEKEIEVGNKPYGIAIIR